MLKLALPQTRPVGDCRKPTYSLTTATRLVFASLLSLWLATGSAISKQPGSAGVSLSNVVINLYREQKYLEALVPAQKAVNFFETTSGYSSSNTAKALLNLAHIYQKIDQYGAGISAFRKALKIFDETPSKFPSEIDDCVSYLPLMLLHENQTDESQIYFHREISLLDAAHVSNKKLSDFLFYSGNAFYDRKNNFKAKPLLLRALAVQKSLPGHHESEVGRTLNVLANIAQDEGDLETARKQFVEVLAIVERWDPRQIPVQLGNLAQIYVSEGHFADGENLYKRALAIREKAADPDLPYTQNNLATLLEDEGKFAEAETLLESAELGVTPKTTRHNEISATVIGNLGNLYANQGRIEEALPFSRRQLALLEEDFGRDNPAIINPLMNIGSDVLETEGADAAEAVVDRVEKILRAAHRDKSYEMVLAYSLRALAKEKRNDFSAAEAAIRVSLATAEELYGKESLQAAWMLMRRADIFQRQRRFADAESDIRQALSNLSSAEGPTGPQLTGPRASLVEILRLEDRIPEALDSLNQLGSKADARLSLPILFRSQASGKMGRGVALERALFDVQTTSQLAVAGAANQLAVRFAAGTGQLAGIIRDEQDTATELRVLDRDLTAQFSKPAKERDEPLEQQLRDKIASFKAKQEQLESAINRSFPDYSRLSLPRQHDLAGIQKRLDDDEALIIIWAGLEESYVFAISHSQAIWRRLDVTGQSIQAAVATLRGALQPDSKRPYDTLVAYNLYRNVLAPVQNLISAKKKWLFVTNSSLAALPLSVLVAADPREKAYRDVDWVVKSHAVTVLPSIAGLDPFASDTAKAPQNPLIAFADPMFRPYSVRAGDTGTNHRSVVVPFRGGVADLRVLSSGLAPLPETASEVRSVADALHASTDDLYLEARATVTNVKQIKLDEFRVVYFATHGLLSGEVEKFAKLHAEPALVLSLPENPTDYDDGLLKASDVAQLRLDADFVVLSACNTAAGELPSGQALSGLARAFIYAGAKSLLVSHWPVASQSTVNLLSHLFKLLASNPDLSPSEALQLSEISLLANNEHREWASPQYWAPFVVIDSRSKRSMLH